jgi:hypothetical protein
MTTFKGGDLNRFRDWIQKRISYPQEAIEKESKEKLSSLSLLKKMAQ